MSYEVTKTWKKFVEKTYFRGEEQDVYDVFQWRDYRKVVDGGRYQVWKNDRRAGNYVPPDEETGRADRRAEAKMQTLLGRLQTYIG